jgi:RimJ/RimL family protein N-acetyltransferase
MERTKMIELPNNLELVGEYVTLRFPRRTDYPVMRDILSDPSNMEHLKFMDKGPRGWTLEEVQQRYERRRLTPQEFTGFMLIVVSNETGKVVGDCGFSNVVIDHRRAEFGLILDRAVWGTFVCKECHLLSLEYGFERMKLHRIEWDTSETNVRMRRFLENIGAHLECMKNGYWIDGDQFTKECVYTVFEESWPSVKENLLSRIRSKNTNERTGTEGFSEYRYRGARVMVALHEEHMRRFLETWRLAKASGASLPKVDDPRRQVTWKIY